jgi:hypothetical protein
MINEYQFLKNIEYVRTGGSKEELKAAEYIQSELKKLGLKSKIEEFDVQASSISKATLEITKPYKKEIPCTGYMNSVSSSITKQVYYLRNKNDERELQNVKDKIVLLDSGMPYWTYKDLLEHGAVGFITSNGTLHDDDTDIDQKEIREPLEKLGRLPGVNIHIKDAYEMIQKDVQEVKITLKQKDIKDSKSRNVVCKIKGEDDDVIVFSAHYDSVPLSKGIYDNATGALTILKIAEAFSKQTPKHTLIFVWCGSEERGLLGSQAYCKKHKKALDKYRLNINIDMIGSHLGEFDTRVSAEDQLAHYIDYFSSEVGFPNKVTTGAYPSDSTSFASNDVPALTFARNTMLEPIHCRYDDITTISEKNVQEDINFIISFSQRMVNSCIIPVKKVIPDNIKEQLDVFNCKKRSQK